MFRQQLQRVILQHIEAILAATSTHQHINDPVNVLDLWDLDGLLDNPVDVLDVWDLDCELSWGRNGGSQGINLLGLSCNKLIERGTCR